MYSSTQYKSAGLVEIDGIYKPSQFLLYKDRIENFEVRDDDIWLTSYPKSGTTWCQELVWLLANDLNYKGAKEDLEKRFPFLEYQSTRDTIEIFLKSIGNTEETPSGIDVIKLLDDDKNQRFIKTHLPWNLLPKQIKNRTKTPKIIHIMRNPKQCAVSYYHHSTKMFPSFIGNLNEYVDLFIQGKVFGGCYFKVVLSYWDRRYLPNLLIITYEEMKSDLDSVIKRVCKFLGKAYSMEDITKLKHHLHFEQMKSNPAVNKSRTIKVEGAQFLRDGSCHGYKRELSEELIHKMDLWMVENLKGSGIPYERDVDN